MFLAGGSIGGRCGLDTTMSLLSAVVSLLLLPLRFSLDCHVLNRRRTQLHSMESLLPIIVIPAAILHGEGNIRRKEPGRLNDNLVVGFGLWPKVSHFLFFFG